MTAGLGALDFTIIAIYFLIVFAIGYWFSRSRSTTDYFLAGRHVGWFAVGASLFATNISSEHFIGLAGSGATQGLPVGCFEWSAAFCLLLLGWVFVPFYLRSRVFTMPEFLERRYNEKCRAFLSGFSILAYIFTKISVGLFAGAILLKQLVGWDYVTSSIFLVVVTGIYTVAGGLSAVIYTDFFQAFVLIGGSVVLAWLGLDAVGGFDGLRATLPPDYFNMVRPMSDPNYPWLGTLVAPFVLGIWYWCTDQVIVQKTLSARNITQARAGTIFAGFLKILPVYTMVLPGLIAKALYPADVTGDNAYPLLVVRLMPSGLVGLMVAALLAALMSSLSSVFNSCSTLITLDFYKKYRPDASEKRLVTVGRISTLAIVVISVAWIPFIPYISSELYLYLQSVQAYIGPPVTAIFLFGVFWKRATGRGALATLIVGLVVGAVRFLLEVIHKSTGADFGPLMPLIDLNFMLFALCVFVLCAAVMVGVSLTSPQEPREKTEGLTWAQRSHTPLGGQRDAAETAALARWSPLHVAATGVLMVVIVGLWWHFR